MNSKIARINSEIERRTAEIINNKLSDPRLKGGLISVTSARTTSDLKFAKVRLYRDNTLVYEGELSSLKRFKDDVKEVARGYECGMGIQNFNDIKEGDVIEAYVMEQINE